MMLQRYDLAREKPNKFGFFRAQVPSAKPEVYDLAREKPNKFGFFRAQVPLAEPEVYE
jgi:hypothetical protein